MGVGQLKVLLYETGWTMSISITSFANPDTFAYARDAHHFFLIRFLAKWDFADNTSLLVKFSSLIAVSRII
jgi:hypothetical protein